MSVCNRSIGEHSGLTTPERGAPLSTSSRQGSLACRSDRSTGEDVFFGPEPPFALSSNGTAASKEESVSLDDYQTQFDVQLTEGIDTQFAVECVNSFTNDTTKQYVKAHAVPHEVTSTPIPGHAEPVTNPACRFGTKIVGFLSEHFLGEVGSEEPFFGSSSRCHAVRRVGSRDGPLRPSDGRAGTLMRCNCTTAGSCRACRRQCRASRKRTVSFAQRVDVISVPTRAQSRCTHRS